MTERELRREIEVFSCPIGELARTVDERAGEREIVSVSHTLWQPEGGRTMASVVLVTVRPR